MSLQMMVSCHNLKLRVKICDPEHNADVVENIVSSFVRREYLDLVFICKRNVQIHCHKMIFASVSELLAKIMNKLDDDIICISLPDVEYKQFEILVNFLYEGITKLNLDELLAVREVARLLGISLDRVEVENVVDGLVKKERLENEISEIPLVEEVVSREIKSNEKEESSLYQNINNNPENKITSKKKRRQGHAHAHDTILSESSEVRRPHSKSDTLKEETVLRSLTINSPQPSVYLFDPLNKDEPVCFEANSCEDNNSTNLVPGLKLQTPSDSDDEVPFKLMDQTPHADKSNLENENVNCNSQSSEQVPKKTECPQHFNTGPETSVLEYQSRYESCQQIQHFNKFCKTEYGDYNPKKYECDICNKRFSYHQHIKTHVRTVHKQEKAYQCNVCCKTFGQNSSLVRHVNNVHKLVRKYQCHICRKRFGQNNHLVTHVKSVHEMVKKYQCNFCSKTFGQKSHMNIHVETLHKMEKNYQCNVCGRSFGTKAYIAKHVDMVHNKIKEYQCYICSKAFGTKSQLVRHMNVVHKKE